MNKESIENWTKVFCLMLETMDFSLDLQKDGKYCIVDEQEAYFGDIESYGDFEKGSAAEIADRLDIYLNDYYFSDLKELADSELGTTHSDSPSTAGEWVKFMDKFPNFKQKYLHEYNVMKLISSHELLDAIDLDDVVRYFGRKS